MTIVYIYADTGVDPLALRQTCTTFGRLLKHRVQLLTANEVIQGIWRADAALFIMPGGADLPYAAKLQGAGNHQIKTYVSTGGAYLGICAGAYYGAAYVEFDARGPLEVVGPRELAFFPGKAIGPVLAPYRYDSYQGARAAVLSGSRYLYYNGGGYFENAHCCAQVMESYENGLPAVIYLNYGSGRVVLSGVHFEYDPALLDPLDPDLQPVITALKTQPEAFLQISTCILHKLGGV